MATLFIHNTALKVDAVIRLQVTLIKSWLKLNGIRFIRSNIWVHRPAIRVKSINTSREYGLQHVWRQADCFWLQWFG